MLSDEQINEIISKYSCHMVYVDQCASIVRKALAIAEKSRWKYPEKGELPEEDKAILFYLYDFSDIHLGCYDKEEDMICHVDGEIYLKMSFVKTWTYAPVMEG